MSKKSIAKILVVAFAATLFLLINALARPVVTKSPPSPQKPDCSKTTDADLVKTLYDEIRADSDLSGLIRQINWVWLF